MADDLIQNIKDTIGCSYELVIIDNSKNEYSIFSAYNKGVRRASGDILCFMHEDIMYHTEAWGQLVTNHFQMDPMLGLVGVVGTHFLAKYASPWWAASMSSGQLIQGSFTNDGSYSIKEEKSWDRKFSNLIESVMVDGLWMCVRRSLFDGSVISFDDITFSGFHCYDADICMQVISAGYKVGIAYDVLIEHKSLGTPDLYYFSQLDIWLKKWERFLPVHKGVTMSDVDIYERNKVCVNYADLFRNNINLTIQLDNVRKSKAYRLGKFIIKLFCR